MYKDLETDRLNLKCISYEDAEFFYKQFSNEEVNRYLFDAEPCTSVDEAKEWIDFYLEPEPRNQHRWIIILKDTGEKAGTCGFHCHNREKAEIEIGYDLYPTYWKHGYAFEALERIIRFAKEKMLIHTVYAHISVDNESSIKAAIKLGFKDTNDRYYEEFHGNKYMHAIYSLEL